MNNQAAFGETAGGGVIDLPRAGALTLDPANGSTVLRTIDAAPQEFPRLDERRFGQLYRYAYTMETEGNDRFQSSGRLYKHDLVEGRREIHDFGGGRQPASSSSSPRSRTPARTQDD